MEDTDMASAKLTELFTDIADAIREKKGTSETLSPKDFSEEIRGIQTGGIPTPDMPVIGDGKTYLYISITSELKTDVPLNFSQSIDNGVSIDWGDGNVQALSGTGVKRIIHTYAEIGEYVISLNPSSGCSLGLGDGVGAPVIGRGWSYGNANRSVLKAVEIGNNVTSLDYRVFSACYSLAHVVIPDGVISLGEGAFRECVSLVNIVLPDSLISISASALSQCYSLANVIIPSNVTSIGAGAFQVGFSLAHITIPNNVTSLGDNAFRDCYSLVNIVLPDSLISIGAGAFNQCYSLANVIIPSNVTSIGAGAFRYCLGVEYFDFSQCTSIPTLADTTAFNDISTRSKIVVPDALYDDWIAATNWVTYASKIVKASKFNA
jgi:hypothetical protein